MGKQLGETSTTVRRRVCTARQRQVNRLGKWKITCNAQLKSKALREVCELDEPARDLLKAAINQFSLSARAYDRILKVSRTIADMEAAENIEMHHVAEAINYRTLDRKLFA